MKNETLKEDAYLEEDISPEETEERRRRLVILILFFLIISVFMLAFTRSNLQNNVIKNECYYDCDILNINTPNYRVDNTGDKKPDTNLGPIGGNKPLYNVTYGKLYKGKGYFNVLTEKYDVDLIDYKEKHEVFNPITTPINNSSYGLFNVDTNNDGWPEINIDFEGKGICDLNCDLDYDLTPDKRIDTDWDGICDLYCEDEEEPENTPVVVEPDKEADVDVNEEESSYILIFEDLDELNMEAVVPGWIASKTFTVTNKGNEMLSYKIDFTNVRNTFTKENNLYYELIKNDEIIRTSERTPYTNGNLVTNIKINPGEVHKYKITFEFKETNKNQDIDKNKEFYTKLQVLNIN